MTPSPANASHYAGSGVSFQYPADWRLDEQYEEGDLTLNIRPDDEGTAFWSLTLLGGRPTVQSALRAVVRAFEEEYEELDSYPAEQEIAGCRAIGRDIDFVCFELTNSATVRVFRTPEFTAVLLSQATDSEQKDYRPGFDFITDSLQLRGLLG